MQLLSASKAELRQGLTGSSLVLEVTSRIGVGSWDCEMEHKKDIVRMQSLVGHPCGHPSLILQELSEVLYAAPQN